MNKNAGCKIVFKSMWKLFQSLSSTSYDCFPTVKNQNPKKGDRKTQFIQVKPSLNTFHKNWHCFLQSLLVAILCQGSKHDRVHNKVAVIAHGKSTSSSTLEPEIKKQKLSAGNFPRLLKTSNPKKQCCKSLIQITLQHKITASFQHQFGNY